MPAAANLAEAPSGVAFEAWPPVLEYTWVSSIRILMFGRFCSMTLETFWNPMSPSAPST